MSHLNKIKIKLSLTSSLLIVISYIVVGQNVVQDSKMAILSVDKDGKLFEAHTGACFMYLNTNNGDFMFKTDANTFETGDRSIDTVLSNNGTQPIIFKSNINENLFRFMEDENTGQMYDMKGVLSINNVDIDCIAQFDPICTGNKNDTKNYRLDLRLAVDAKKVILKGLENKLTKQVVFEVGRGKLNITN
jgi:hypothetical protein